MVVYKYPLTIGRQINTISIPRQHKVLTVGMDYNNVACVWILVEPDSPLIDKLFFIYATGEEVRWHENYIGTITTKEMLKWHVFGG